MSLRLNARNISDYLDHPIFIHALNRELHDAIGRGVDKPLILSAVRVFSVLSGQIMFCNVSQIHEVFYDEPDALKEFSELALVGRFIAHSDYGSFEEFRESRAEHFLHTIKRHPGFYQVPSPELRRLPHGSLGTGISTTDFIERNLRDWLEGDRKNSLTTSLSENDEKSLRQSEEWLKQTLDQRDQKALTFDVFERTSGGIYLKKAEGAVRRALTEAYVASYIEAYSARCIWGIPGINHFEKSKLLAGLHLGFARTVLTETGISDTLRRSRDFGRKKRLISENSSASAFLRQSYFELASVIDESFGSQNAWYICDAKVRSHLHRLISSGALRPTVASHDYEDLLLRAGERISSAAKDLKGEPVEAPPDSKIHASRRSFKDSKGAEQGGAGSVDVVQRPRSGELGKLHWWESYVVLVAAGGLLLAAATYVSAPLFYPGLGGGLRLLFSIVGAMVGGAIIFWFHPDNWFRRITLAGVCMATYGGLSYRLELANNFGTGHGLLEMGNLPSAILTGGGILIAVVGIVADAIFRGRRQA